MKAIKITDISIDGGTQQRERIAEDVVEEYAEAMRCGAKFPAVTVFHDGAQYWLADGFHRFHASRRAEMLDILADVREGTRRDAILFSASANGTHGMRLTNADKRKSVLLLLLDKEWTQWSNRDIAKHCHVSPAMVDKLRKELEPVQTKVPTVGTPPSKPNNHAGVVSELPKKEAVEAAPEEPEEEYTEADYLRDQLAQAQAENLRLAESIASGNGDAELEETFASLKARVEELEAENARLRDELHQMTVSRDFQMQKASDLQKQVNYMKKFAKAA